jgi:hypothetical protein
MSSNDEAPHEEEKMYVSSRRRKGFKPATSLSSRGSQEFKKSNSDEFTQPATIIDSDTSSSIKLEIDDKKRYLEELKKKKTKTFNALAEMDSYNAKLQQTKNAIAEVYKYVDDSSVDVKNFSIELKDLSDSIRMVAEERIKLEQTDEPLSHLLGKVEKLINEAEQLDERVIELQLESIKQREIRNNPALASTLQTSSLSNYLPQSAEDSISQKAAALLAQRMGHMGISSPTTSTGSSNDDLKIKLEDKKKHLEDLRRKEWVSRKEPSAQLLSTGKSLRSQLEDPEKVRRSLAQESEKFVQALWQDSLYRKHTLGLDLVDNQDAKQFISSLRPPGNTSPIKTGSQVPSHSTWLDHIKSTSYTSQALSGKPQPLLLQTTPVQESTFQQPSPDVYKPEASMNLAGSLDGDYKADDKGKKLTLSERLQMRLQAKGRKPSVSDGSTEPIRTTSYDSESPQFGISKIDEVYSQNEADTNKPQGTKIPENNPTLNSGTVNYKVGEPIGEVKQDKTLMTASPFDPPHQSTKGYGWEESKSMAPPSTHPSESPQQRMSKAPATFKTPAPPTPPTPPTPSKPPAAPFLPVKPAPTVTAKPSYINQNQTQPVNSKPPTQSSTTMNNDHITRKASESKVAHNQHIHDKQVQSDTTHIPVKQEHTSFHTTPGHSRILNNTMAIPQRIQTTNNMTSEVRLTSPTKSSKIEELRKSLEESSNAKKVLDKDPILKEMPKLGAIAQLLENKLKGEIALSSDEECSENDDASYSWSEKGSIDMLASRGNLNGSGFSPSPWTSTPSSTLPSAAQFTSPIAPGDESVFASSEPFHPPTEVGNGEIELNQPSENTVEAKRMFNTSPSKQSLNANDWEVVEKSHLSSDENTFTFNAPNAESTAAFVPNATLGDDWLNTLADQQQQQQESHPSEVESNQLFNQSTNPFMSSGDFATNEAVQFGHNPFFTAPSSAAETASRPVLSFDQMFVEPKENPTQEETIKPQAEPRNEYNYVCAFFLIIILFV